MHPRYGRLCPTECEYGKFDYDRTKNCDDCPALQPERVFRANVLEAWEDRLKEKARKFNFDKVLSILYNVIAAETMPRRTAKSAFLVNMYVGERNYFEDEDRYINRPT